MAPTSARAISTPNGQSRTKGSSNETLRPTVLKSQGLFFPEDPAFSQTHPLPPSLVKQEQLQEPANGSEKASEDGSKRPGRASRKSKAAALANMDAQSAALKASLQAESDNRARADSKHAPPEPSSTSDLTGPGPHLHSARKAAARPKATGLDFSTLSLTMPPDFPQRSQNRLFDLPHCPVFHPTPQEFSEPLKYIEKISREAMPQHGIVKVVPPQGWKPPFSLDSQTFRFKTRVQRLNSMEASARANVNFLEQLAAFHTRRTGPEVTIPVIQGQTLDLWRLQRCVHELGGYALVSKDRLWLTVAQNLGLDPRIDSTLGGRLKRAYSKIIKPFDIYLESMHLAGALNTPSSPQKSSPTASASSTPSSSSKQKKSSSPNVVTREQVQQASDKLNTALNNINKDTADTADAAMSVPIESLPRSGIEVGEACEVCLQDHDPEHIILCDECDRAYHLACLTPPMDTVPRGTWICDGCILSTGADFGFDSGTEHTLYSYRKRADEFKRQWLHRQHKDVTEDEESKNDNGLRLSAQNPADWNQMLQEEAQTEQDFWRLVESPDVSVEVEYGADLHSAKYGSGFPSLERQAQQPYARDGWNLNNLPIVNGSLLRYIRSDIAGMTNPWLYAGMIFSTFAWHKEDHYTYSINYHHFGETKTWYGVPSEDDFKLEAAMRNAAPQLFEQQPDLMFQLVTLLSPNRLKAEGVRVSACDQRAGEFVITLPRAYHAGFNHGFNVCEAVNFCLPDWLPHGLACVKHYSEIRKPPVFSHDQLICTIFQHEKSPQASKWLAPFFKEMVNRELDNRRKARESIPDLQETVEDVDLSDEQTQCTYCQVYCHLSQIYSPFTEAVSCANHIKLVHGEESVQMRIRYLDADLHLFLKRCDTRANTISPSQSPKINCDGEHRSSTKRSSATALEANGEEGLPATQKLKLTISNPNRSNSETPPSSIVPPQEPIGADQ